MMGGDAFVWRSVSTFSEITAVKFGVEAQSSVSEEQGVLFAKVGVTDNELSDSHIMPMPKNNESNRCFSF